MSAIAFPSVFRMTAAGVLLALPSAGPAQTAAAVGGGPSITGITNAYSNIAPGAPNYGIAQGSLFVIYGSNLATGSDLAEAIPLATTLLGTSVTYKDSTGNTMNVGLYYVTAGQIAGVMPSAAKTGAGTLTVRAPGNNSVSVPLTVVDSALGIDTRNGTGGGQGVATDKFGKLFGYNHSAMPGQKLIFWGSGVGADTNNDDLSIQHNDNLSNIPMTVYVGGVAATINYRGRSPYPGVDQIIVTVPPGAAAQAADKPAGRAAPSSLTYGCNVAVVFVSGASKTASNAVTVPVTADGSPCSEANSLLSGPNVTALAGKSNVHFGFLGVIQNVETKLGTAAARVGSEQPHAEPLEPRAATLKTTNAAFGDFWNIPGDQFATYAASNNPSIGSCTYWQTSGEVTAPPLFYKTTGLDAGDPKVANPLGETATLIPVPTLPGFHTVQLPGDFIPATGGTFKFSFPGGKDIGSGGGSITMGSPLFVWTEEGTITSVNRSAGVEVDWNASSDGTFVRISGTSYGNGVTAGYYCLTLRSLGSFFVPGYVTGQLPAGTGTMTVADISAPVQFTASGLDLGYLFAGVSNFTTVTYE